MKPLTSACGMVVERRGHGPPVFLIHGLGGPMMWEKLVPLLAGSHEVIIPHLPGFGESPAPGRKLTSEDHAVNLGELAASMDLTGLRVAGVSYGGDIAAHLAMRVPRRVSRLVLICPTGAGNYHALRFIRALSGDRFNGLKIRFLGYPAVAEFLSRRSYYRISNRPPDLVERYLGQLSRPGHGEALLHALDDIAGAGADLPRLLAGAPVPVTLVWGRYDRTIPPPPEGLFRSAGMESAPLPDLVVIPDCGHSVPLENPVKLAEIIGAGPSLSGAAPV